MRCLELNVPSKTITSYYNGYKFAETLTVLTVASTGTIGGTGAYYNGQVLFTVVNFGHIFTSPSSGLTGVRLPLGGVLINEQGATISGDGRGVSIADDYRGRAYTSFASIVNGGTILGGTDFGIYLGYNDAHQGVIVNGSASDTLALISGHTGISDPSGSVYTNHTITNFGTIRGTGGAGTGGVLIESATSETIVNGSALHTNALITGNTGVFGVSTNYGPESFITLTNYGTIQGTGGQAVTFLVAQDRLIEEGSGQLLGGVAGGRGTLELGAAGGTGTLTGLGSGITNFSALVFDGGARWTVGGSDTSTGFGGISISGFGNGDTIDLSGFVATSSTFASNALTLTSAINAHEILHIQGNFAKYGFTVQQDGAGGTDIFACFLPGTLIGTERGEVAVEELAVGDIAVTASGRHRPLRWIGIGSGLVTRGQRTAATPIIVRKGALADGIPHTDLRITKGHSLYLDGVLIPAEFLINHRSIVWDDMVGEVKVFHLELDDHDILLANGAPAESYRDDGNRWLFQNLDDGWDPPAVAPCAPVLTGGAAVDAVWRRLLDRAGGPALTLTADPDLHLVVDGRRLDAEARYGDEFVFHLPAFPVSLRIASRAAAPDVAGIARDPRRLGVGIAKIEARRGHLLAVIEASDERLTAGFHAYEPDNEIRWTNGDAELPAGLFAALAGQGFKLVLTKAGMTQYPAPRGVARRAAA
jgi:hypothetical protein